MSWTTSFPCPTTVRPARPERQGVFPESGPVVHFVAHGSRSALTALPMPVATPARVATRGDGVARSVLRDRGLPAGTRPRQPGASALVRRRQRWTDPRPVRRPRRRRPPPRRHPSSSAPPAYAAAPAAVHGRQPADSGGAVRAHDAHHDDADAPVRQARARREHPGAGRARRLDPRDARRARSRRSPGSSWRSSGCGGPRALESAGGEPAGSHASAVGAGPVARRRGHRRAPGDGRRSAPSLADDGAARATDVIDTLAIESGISAGVAEQTRRRDRPCSAPTTLVAGAVTSFQCVAIDPDGAGRPCEVHDRRRDGDVDLGARADGQRDRACDPLRERQAAGRVLGRQVVAVAEPAQRAGERHGPHAAGVGPSPRGTCA